MVSTACSCEGPCTTLSPQRLARCLGMATRALVLEKNRSAKSSQVILPEAVQLVLCWFTCGYASGSGSLGNLCLRTLGRRGGEVSWSSQTHKQPSMGLCHSPSHLHLIPHQATCAMTWRMMCRKTCHTYACCLPSVAGQRHRVCVSRMWYGPERAVRSGHQGLTSGGSSWLVGT